MGEPGVPSQEERARRRSFALEVVSSVRNDTEMPLPERQIMFERHGQSRADTKKRVEQIVFELAQEICSLTEELRFISAHGLMAVQTATPHEVRLKMIHEMRAACRGELPDWWDEEKRNG